MENRKLNFIEEKSFSFSLEIIKTFQYLTDIKREFILSKQLIRSGTSIGANITEAEYAQSKPDFISKMNIALKEAAETNYWLRLLSITGYLNQEETTILLEKNKELIRILTAIIKTTKNNSDSG